MDGVFYLPADSPSPSSSTRPRNSHPSPVTAISRDLSQTHLSRTQVLPRSDSFVLHQPRLRGESGPTLGSFQSSRQSTFPYSKPRPLPKDPPYRFSSWDGPRPSSQTLKRTLAESRSEMLSEIPVETSLYQAEALPCHLSSAGNGYTITHETLARLLQGDFPSVANYVILDCRYAFEYEGGHICGAINVPDAAALDALYYRELPQDTVFIFHCEFSKKRGPRGLRYFRSIDREANINLYPHITYKEIYLLEKGYKEFFHNQTALCSPCGYIPMRHPEFTSKVKQENKIDRRIGQIKEICRSQSFSDLKINEQDIDVTDDRSFGSHSSAFRELSNSANNMFKSSPIGINNRRSFTKHSRKRSTDDMDVPYSPPKLSELEEPSYRKSLRAFYNKRILSASLPDISLFRFDDSSSEASSTEDVPQFGQPLQSLSSNSSSSLSFSPITTSKLSSEASEDDCGEVPETAPLFGSLMSHSSGRLKKGRGNGKRFSFLTPPSSNDSSPSHSRSASPTPLTDVSPLFGKFSRSLSVPSLLSFESRDIKRRRFSPSSTIDEQD